MLGRSQRVAVSSAAAGGDRIADIWVIEPRSPGLLARLREMWRYRYLLAYFSKQCFVEIFRQSRLGVLWIFMRAGLPVVITAFVFGEVAGFPSGSTPYVLFIMIGTVPWQLFEFSLLWATRSMNKYSRLLTRMYFPRILVLPPSTMQALLMTAALIVMTLVVTAMFWVRTGTWYFGAGPETGIAVIALIYAWVVALGIALWTSVLDAPARDVRYSLRFFLRFWFFLTPVAYPLSSVPPQWQWVFALNPITAPVEGFRLGVLGEGLLLPESVLSSTLTLLFVGVGGLVFFGRVEATMADRL